MSIAVFVDRDGTLNQEKGYIRDLNDLQLIPGAAKGIQLLKEQGALCILVTNQTGAARGFYDEDHILALNKRLDDLLFDEAGVRLDAYFYCPHIPTDMSQADPGKVVNKEYQIDCDCRKPQPGMIHQAVQQFNDINLSESYMVGDKASDLELAKNAGCNGILLKSAKVSNISLLFINDNWL